MPRKKPETVAGATHSMAGSTKTAGASTPPKHPGGRPTSYRQEFCAHVIEWGRLGKSRTWMAANLEVDRKTIDNWASANPEFVHALSRAKALEQAYWEDLGHDGLSADRFNSGVWSKSMAARFPDEWRDKQEVSGPAGGPIQHQVGISWMTEEQAKARGWA